MVLARRALKNFRKGAKAFPGARSPFLLVEGLLHQLQGRSATARAKWQECISVAERASMPYERAMAQYELGRHSSDASERATLLRAARDAFDTIGMPRYAARCTDAARPAELSSAPTHAVSA